MASFKSVFLTGLCAVSVFCTNAQVTYIDGSGHQSMDSIPPGILLQKSKNKNAFPLKGMLVPAVLITYGAISIKSDQLKDLNHEVRDEVYMEHPHKRFPLDNYLQFAPAAAVYGLNAMGIQGKHNFRDRSMIYLMSNLILNTTVFSVKKLTHEQRPDGSDYLSFPSGHTTEAFASAEFLYQEYKDKSPWYGIAGYAVAASTGYLRMYNNKHWLNDVVAGAGVGIMSTKLAYWLYPKIQHHLFKDKPANTIIVPTYQSGAVGFGMVHTF